MKGWRYITSEIPPVWLRELSPLAGCVPNEDGRNAETPSKPNEEGRNAGTPSKGNDSLGFERYRFFKSMVRAFSYTDSRTPGPTRRCTSVAAAMIRSVKASCSKATVLRSCFPGFLIRVGEHLVLGIGAGVITRLANCLERPHAGGSKLARSCCPKTSGVCAQ